MFSKLNGQVAMISGASKGIGFAIANALAAEGVRLSISGRNAADLEKAASTLRDAHGISCFTCSGDMGNADFIERWVDQTANEFGNIDILVNNAGSAPPGGFEAQSDEDWKSAFEVKPFGYIRAARSALAHLRKANGRIINIIGLAGHQPLPKFFIGGAADGALMNFTKSLADEVAKDGIRVNAISPGFTRTERWEILVAGSGAMMGVAPDVAERHLLSTMPLGRPAEMTEIASVALFLASNMSSYITGVTIPVDGGATRSF